jgi:hypothetical protein
MLILDTGPIRELITFKAVFGLGFMGLKRELHFLLGQTAYETFTRFLLPFRAKATASGVVVELHHWIRNTDRTGQVRMWSLVYDEFLAMGMDEQSVKLLDMPRDLVARCGPADISLLSLAKRHAPSGPLVVTIERELAAECQRAGIRALRVEDILRNGHAVR